MSDATRGWHDEHMYFNRLLQLLRRELDVFATGETPNYQLMLDVITYLRDWSDHVHHPREDAVFSLLAERSPPHRLQLARLQQEHRIIAAAGESLRKLLEGVAADRVVSRTELEVAAATYLVYYGNHIVSEEEEILPLADSLLTPQEWKAAKDAVPGHGDPLLGTDPQGRFHDLRRRMALEAG